MNFKEIIKSIENGVYQPIYFLNGENTYFIDKISNKLLNSVLEESEKDFNETIFYGKDSNIKVAKKFLESRIKLCDSKIYVSEVDKCLTGFIQLYPIFSSTRVSKYWLLNDLKQF